MDVDTFITPETYELINQVLGSNRISKLIQSSQNLEIIDYHFRT